MVDMFIPVGAERGREDYRLITGHASYVYDLRAEQGRPVILLKPEQIWAKSQLPRQGIRFGWIPCLGSCDFAPSKPIRRAELRRLRSVGPGKYLMHGNYSSH